MKIPIVIGPLCEPLSRQLAGTKLSKRTLAQFDYMAKSLCACWLHGLMTESQYETGGRKLIRKIRDAFLATHPIASGASGNPLRYGLRDYLRRSGGIHRSRNNTGDLRRRLSHRRRGRMTP